MRAAWATLGWWLLAAATAAAHSFDPALLDLHETSPDTFDVVWKTSAASTASPFGAIAPHFPASCRVDAGDAAASDDAGGEPRRLRLDCRPGGLRGLPLGVDGLAGARVDALVRIVWRDGSVASGVCRAGDATFVVPGVASGAAPAAVVRRYLGLGAMRFLGGVDHLLFAIALLLVADRAGGTLRTLAAFVLAHSVTLVLASRGGVTLPAAPVDATIALGIVSFATELARPTAAPATLTARAPWVAAFVFGLLHGAGLADGLARAGIPADRAPLALASFNAGVEFALLAFVVAMQLPLAAWRRTARRSAWRLVPVYALGALAMAWTIERVLAIVS